MNARALVMAGTIPDRSQPAGELRWLRADAAAARRYFMRWGGHDAECRMILADWAVEKFLRAHPEFCA